MTDPGSAPLSSVPSSRRLLRSTAIALAVAGVILVTIVLPAEYGIDPTGIGKLLGLKEMGEIKMQLAREEASHEAEDAGAAGGDDAEAPAPTSAAPPAMKSDAVEVRLAPNEGKEIKLVMLKDSSVNYSWVANGGAVNYDKHADAPGIQYHGYGKGTAVRADSGVLTAAFDGSHGWFWRNRGTDTVTVTLKTTGAYTELKRLP